MDVCNIMAQNEATRTENSGKCFEVSSSETELV